MKKFTFILMMLLAYAGFTMAQTIEDFESIKMNPMEFGKTGKMTVVANPDPIGNPSLYCVEFLRADTNNAGRAWSGFWSSLPVPVDVTVNKYVHVKVWKTRISPIKFKIEGGTAGNLEIPSMNPQTLTNAWEEIVFDFSAKTGTYPIIALMPDFQDPFLLNGDLTMYFDEIYVNNDPAVGSAPVQIIENFETIQITRLSGGAAEDASSFTVVENPDPSGINTSSMVLDFTRDKDAVSWTGIWANVTNVDVTTNKYVHVKLWKPRISEVKFKLQDGAAGTLEIASMNTQTKVNAWEDFVFDFSGKTGTYPIIALLVDMTDAPLTEDNHIYIDDIVVNNKSKQSVGVVFNVDMHGAGLTAGQKVYVAGNFTGWAIPDTKPEYEMMDADGDSIYSYSMVDTVGAVYAFKFFKGGSGWDGGEWAGDPNRALTVTGDMAANYIWGSNGMVGVAPKPLAGKIRMYPNPVRDELRINTSVDVSKVIITNTVGKVIRNFNYSSNETISTSNLSRGIYFVTFIGRDGNKETQKLIKN